MGRSGQGTLGQHYAFPCHTSQWRMPAPEPQFFFTGEGEWLRKASHFKRRQLHFGSQKQIDLWFFQQTSNNSRIPNNQKDPSTRMANRGFWGAQIWTWQPKIAGRPAHDAEVGSEQTTRVEQHLSAQNI